MRWCHCKEVVCIVANMIAKKVEKEGDFLFLLM
jgi:hypothetical protein